jgi:hypothetical protein
LLGEGFFVPISGKPLGFSETPKVWVRRIQFSRRVVMTRFSLVVAVVLVAAMAMAAPGLTAERTQNEAALDWLRGAQESDGGFSMGFAAGSDFGATVEVILSAVAAGEDVSGWVTAAGASPLDYVWARVAAGQVTEVGDLSRALLVAVATGQDPRAFGGRDLVGAVLAAQDGGTGWFGDTLFKHALAVLALRNAGADVPASGVAVLRENLTEDGAWALFGGTAPGTADTNTTALAMQALVAVGEVDAAAGALPYLQRMQNEDGGFPYQKPSPWGTESDANSTAGVLQALKALGEPLGRWAPQGTDPVGALMSLWDASSGAYLWQAAVPFANMLATAQAVQASEGMSLAAVAVVGAARAPGGLTAAPVAAPAAGTVLLPASGAASAHWLLLVAVAMAGAGEVLRKR